MNPKWRTSTVVAICGTMRQTHDYSACNILADALQDAGCPEGYRFDGTPHDVYLLERLRGPLEKHVAQRLVAQIYSVETEKAVGYLKWVSDKIGQRHEYPNEDYYEYMNYDYMVEMGYEAVEKKYYCFGTDEGSEYFNGTFYDNDDREKPNRLKFFEAWTKITGIMVPEEDQDAIQFRCAC